MTTKRRPDFSLAAAVHDPGFTPRSRDVGALVDLIAGADEDTAGAAARALARLGPDAAPAALARIDAAEEPLRSRLAALLGRLGRTAEVIALLGDRSPRTRKSAAGALGRLGRAAGDGAEAALAAALGSEGAPEVRRAVAAALGKVGGPGALDALRAAAPALDPASASRAVIMVERTAARDEPSAFVATRDAPGPTPVVLRCRAGLERLLAAELDAELEPRVLGEGRVRVELRGPPSRLFQARTMLSFGFPLDLPAGGELGDAVAGALASDACLRLVRHFTAGPLRYRLDWAQGGKRRSVVWRIAEAVSRRRPELVNDPTRSTWEAVVHERSDGAWIELVPRFEDPRFAYRRGDVPAASHPTIAAALARVGGALADDVVWDPFVGSGTELCERALAGPYRRLVGTDRSAAALAVAKENLAAAGAPGAELYQADASTFAPELPPSLVITNPPMGRRVLRGVDLGAFFERFLAHAARVLAPDGRLAWVSPLPARTLGAAERLGLRLELRQEIDMGGFRAELQLFRKAGSAGTGTSPRRSRSAGPAGRR